MDKKILITILKFLDRTNFRGRELRELAECVNYINLKINETDKKEEIADKPVQDSSR